MPPDCYKVEVLHFLNPHLIWVEVRDPTSQNGFNFEQIGIYGVLPLDTTIDLENEDFAIQRCEEWLPAAAALMQQLLEGGGEIRFTTTFIDRRSSIFDDNIHKFGDLLIKGTNGRSKSLSKLLRTSGFATYDECQFHQNLREGKIKTKLTSSATRDVIKQIEQYFLRKNVPEENWVKPIKSQTSVFRATYDLETSLTAANVDKHNQSMRKLIESKKKDLELCKGVDERSVGRGSSRKLQEVKEPTPVEKKLMLLNARKHKFVARSQDVQQTPEYAQAFEDTKKFLEVNATTHPKKISTQTDEHKLQIVKKIMCKSNKNVAKQEQIKTKTQELEVEKLPDKLDESTSTISVEQSQDSSGHHDVSNNESNEIKPLSLDQDQGKFDETKKSELSTSSEHDEEPKFIRIRPKRKPSKREQIAAKLLKKCEINTNTLKESNNESEKLKQQQEEVEIKKICICPFKQPNVVREIEDPEFDQNKESGDAAAKQLPLNEQNSNKNPNKNLEGVFRIMEVDVFNNATSIDQSFKEMVEEIMTRLELSVPVDYNTIKEAITQYRTGGNVNDAINDHKNKATNSQQTDEELKELHESAESSPIEHEENPIILKNGMELCICPVHDQILILDRIKCPKQDEALQCDMGQNAGVASKETPSQQQLDDNSTQCETEASGSSTVAPSNMSSTNDCVPNKKRDARKGRPRTTATKASDVAKSRPHVKDDTTVSKDVASGPRRVMGKYHKQHHSKHLINDLQASYKLLNEVKNSKQFGRDKKSRKKLKKEQKKLESQAAMYGPPGIDIRQLNGRVPPIQLYDDITKGQCKYNCKSKRCDHVNSSTSVSSDNSEPLPSCSKERSKRYRHGNKDTSPSRPISGEQKLKLHTNIKKMYFSFISDTTPNQQGDGSRKGFAKNGESIESLKSKITQTLADLHIKKPVGPIFNKERTHYYTYHAYLGLRTNPYLNCDRYQSVFVENLVTPAMMVHSKMEKRIVPTSQFRDTNFSEHIRLVLTNLKIQRPMLLQTITWNAILTGHSVFIIGSACSGKTMGYLPAVCRLVTDGHATGTDDGVGPICVIVCATSQSVSDVEKIGKMMLGCNEKVVSSYYGHDEMAITTALLNGCEMLISTAPSLVRLLQADFGVDLRRLSTFVLDDCERLSEVYASELKFCFNKINEMLRTRINKELKMQYVVASRVWCDFMEPLAKKAADTVVCIGSFQECVIYARANMTVSFVKETTKLHVLYEFLEEVDRSKRTVVICDTDKEVALLCDAIKDKKYSIFATDSNMTVEGLYKLSVQWKEFREPTTAPILICRDSNLYHLNIVNANYLVQYSMPPLYSTFCRRFATLNESYPSIFKTENQDVKILILLEESNVEQFPKIINFVKRCRNNVPDFIDGICETVLAKKDAIKAENCAPLCFTLLSLGVCPDLYNCISRHTLHKDYDKPKDWVPTSGMIKFKMLHYHSASHYSARLIANFEIGSYIKYPPAYSSVSLKMGIHFSNVENRILVGIPKIGDICAVALGNSYFSRCQVIKIIDKYENGNPNNVLVNLIDEELMETARDIDLYHLPDDLKNTDTYVVHVRIANIKPRDKDVVFSKLALNQIMLTMDDNHSLYLKGQVALAIGNCVFVDTLEVCQDLKSLNETVVISNFKRDLLIKHAEVNNEHIPKLKELCQLADLDITPTEKIRHEIVETVEEKPMVSWSYLDRDMVTIYFGSVEDPDTLFCRVTKYEDCLKILIKDIQSYVATNTLTLEEFKKDDIVLAEYPDDLMYERARIDDFNELKVKCFFVDQGEWRHLTKDKLKPISDKLLTQMPFQAIECRLLGVLPPGDQWTDYSTNWLHDKCFENHHNGMKQLFVKYFTEEPAQFTGGHKYGVIVIDTYGEQDVIINKQMIDLNLAKELKDESMYFDFMQYHTVSEEKFTNDSTDSDDWEKVSKHSENSNKNELIVLGSHPLAAQPLRSLPLVGSDDDSEEYDKWNINICDVFEGLLGPVIGKVKEIEDNKLLAIEASETNESQEMSLNIQDKNTEQILHELQDPKLNGDVSKDLDSDDLSAPEVADSTTDTLEKPSPSPEECQISLDLGRKESKSTEECRIIDPNVECQLRKPKLVWRQTKTIVTIKILLIGVENYDLDIQERALKFNAIANDTNYGFEFDLYGVVDSENGSHSNKGQYILVKLTKVLKRNWLTLTKDNGCRKWIMYDVDSIDTSSDEEEVRDDNLINIVKNMQNNSDSDSDEDFVDDVSRK